MKRPLLIILMLIFVFTTWVQALPYYYTIEPVEVGNLAPRIKRSSPFVAGDKILTIRMSGTILAAIDANTGEILWETPLGGAAVPDVWADWRRVYVATGERATNQFMAFDLMTGRRAYYNQIPGDSDRSYNSRLLPVGDLILVPVEGGVLSAFDKNDGSEVWTVELPGSIEVISAKEDVVYVCCGKHLMALNAEGGEVIWDQEFTSEVIALGIGEGYVLAGIESKIYLINSATGEVLPDPITLRGGNVVAGEIPCRRGLAYVMSTGGFLNIIDLSEGEIDEFPRLAKNAYDQPIIAGNALIFWSRSEGISLYDLNVGEKAYIPEYGEFKPIFRARLDVERWSLVFLDSSGSLMSIKLPRAGFIVKELDAMDNLTVSVEGVVSLYSNDSIVPTIEVRSPEGDLLWLEVLPSITPLLRTRKTSFSFTLSKPFSYVELKVLMEGGNVSWIHRIELPYKETGVVPPKVVGSATFSMSELGTLTVGETFEVKGTVVANVSGELELDLAGEGILSKTVSLGWVDAGVEKQFSIQTIPTAPGTISIQLTAKLNGTEIGETTLSGTCVQGKLLESVSPSTVSVNKGDTVNLKVKVKNRLLDNVVLKVEASSDITNKSSVEIGPLKAGEEKEVLLHLEAIEKGSSEILVKVFREDKVVEQASLAISVGVGAPTPTPTASPSPSPTPTQTPSPISPAETLWKALAPVTSFLEPYIGLWGSRLVVLGLMAGIPLAVILKVVMGRRRERPAPAPTPIVEEIGPEEIEIIRPKPPELEIVPVTPPEEEVPIKKPEVEVEVPTVYKEIEARMNQIAGKLASLRQRAKSYEEEGFTGLVDKVESLHKLLYDVRVEVSEGKYDYAKQLLDSLESNMISLDRHLDSLEQLIGSWNKIEGRIKMMLSLWGKAPASLLTTIPEDLRIIALARFAKLHPEMNLEIKGDELILLEE